LEFTNPAAGRPYMSRHTLVLQSESALGTEFVSHRHVHRTSRSAVAFFSMAVLIVVIRMVRFGLGSTHCTQIAK